MMSHRRLLLGLAFVSSLFVSSYGVLLPSSASTIPRQTQSPPGPATCSNLVQRGTIGTISGVILYNCGDNTPAIKIPSPGLTPAMIPTFTLPRSSGTVGPLSVWSVTSGTPCSTLIALTSGVAPHLHPGSYDYCLSYSNFPSSGGVIPSFTITWS